jgi:hypothetical protein
MRIVEHTSVCFVHLVILVSCASSEPPMWINQVPGQSEGLCAVGVSGPTYYAEDARSQSQSLAFTELARVLEVRVQSDTTVYSQGSNQHFDTSLQEVAGLTSDVVLKQAQVKGQWVHPGDDRQYGAKGTVFTLVCMPAQPH